MESRNRDNLQAVLWDMDGAPVDTEPFWMAAQRDLAQEHGVTWTHDDARSAVGQAMEVSACLIQGSGVELPAREIIDGLLDRVVSRLENGIPWLPGAERILAELARTNSVRSSCYGPQSRCVTRSIFNARSDVPCHRCRRRSCARKTASGAVSGGC